MAQRGHLDTLRAFLGRSPQGRVTEPLLRVLVARLAACWGELTNVPVWLLNHIETVTWYPPILRLEVSTGSTTEPWQVDVARGIAVRGPARYEVSPPDLAAIGDEIVGAILAGQDHAALKWSADRYRVAIQTGVLVPAWSVPAFSSRRRRLRALLRERLLSAEWREVPGKAPNTYEWKPAVGQAAGSDECIPATVR